MIDVKVDWIIMEYHKFEGYSGFTERRCAL